jgi:Domain of unknown function (DUF1707)
MAGPGDETAAVANRGRLRASHADREQVIGTLKTAFVQGRLTEDELDARADRVYASRTYAELAGVTAEVTADIPVEPVRSRRPRDPWRATKIAWRIEYAVFLPGIVGILLTPGGPHTTLADGIALTAVVYVIFWALGVYMLLNSRRQR